MSLDELNHLDRARVESELLRCCGSRRWAEALALSRPFADPSGLFAKADASWRELSSEDWLEAFSRHPRIGAKTGAKIGPGLGSAQWASDEQKGAAAAPESVLSRLAAGNAAYERRFGYIFIVCATGKSAEEMLALLESRIRNQPDQELLIAATEQVKITRIRLEKLLS